MPTDQPHPNIHAVFDLATWTFSYVVHDGPSSPCVVIDSVLNYDPKSGRTQTHSADQLISYIRDNQLTLQWILETHAHADHLSAAGYLKKTLGGKTAISHQITQVQQVFKSIYNLPAAFQSDGSQFDHLLVDQEQLPLGARHFIALAVPGHTPACMAYQFGEAVFVGDTLFMPDVGTARCDFPGGDAHQLYASIRRLLSLPKQTRLYLCHDYPPAGRAPAFVTTVGEQCAQNIHVRDTISAVEFVQMRKHRDAGLEMPVLILPSIQVNIRAGELPPAESNGIAYLKIPLNAL